MKRQAILISAGLLGIALSACGEPATRQLASGTPAVAVGAGLENRLRVEAPPAARCGETFQVYVYLDDLVPHPSPNTTRNYGLGGIEADLYFDPRILRVENVLPDPSLAVYVLLAPGLPGFSEEQSESQAKTSQATVDVVPRYLILVSGNNAKGVAGLNASVFNDDPNTGRPLDGTDPTVTKAPERYFIVEFRANSEGTSQLDVEAKLTDGLLEFYEPVVTVDGLVKVSGGDCPDEPVPTPRFTELPSATQYPPGPSITPVVASRVTPTSASLSRPDCPTDWAAAMEAAFTFCYPAELRVSRSEVNGFPSYNLASPEAQDEAGRVNTFFMVVAHGPARSFDPTVQCQGISGLEQAVAFEQTTLTVDGFEVEACESAGFPRGEPFRSVRADVPTRQGFINILVNYRGPDFESVRGVVDQIMMSLVLN